MRDRASFIMDARHEAAEGRFGVALDLYRKALRAAEEAAEAADPLLHVRIADLHHRLGHERSALESYRLAAERYRGEGLILNAVAVWKRVRRCYPREIEPHRALAALNLDQDLVAEARLHLFHFVEAADRVGRTEDALDALVDFLAVAYDEEVARVLHAYQALLRRRESRDETRERESETELAEMLSRPAAAPTLLPARAGRRVRRVLPMLPGVAPAAS